MATQGGSVLPVHVIVSGDLEENGGAYKLRGGPAIPVHGIVEANLTGDDVISDGVEIPVYVVPAGWARRRAGGSSKRIVNWISTNRPVAGKVAQPIYLVTGSLS